MLAGFQVLFLQLGNQIRQRHFEGGDLEICVFQFGAPVGQAGNVQLGFVLLGVQLFQIHSDPIEVALGCDINLAAHLFPIQVCDLFHRLMYLSEHPCKLVLHDILLFLGVS